MTRILIDLILCLIAICLFLLCLWAKKKLVDEVKRQVEELET